LSWNKQNKRSDCKALMTIPKARKAGELYGEIDLQPATIGERGFRPSIINALKADGFISSRCNKYIKVFGGGGWFLGVRSTPTRHLALNAHRFYYFSWQQSAGDASEASLFICSPGQITLAVAI